MKWKIKIKISFGAFTLTEEWNEIETERKLHETTAMSILLHSRETHKRKKTTTRRGKTNKIARYQIILKITYRLCNDHICICPHTQCNNIFVSLCAITIFFFLLSPVFSCFGSVFLRTFMVMATAVKKFVIKKILFSTHIL